MNHSITEHIKYETEKSVRLIRQIFEGIIKWKMWSIKNWSNNIWSNKNSLPFHAPKGWKEIQLSSVFKKGERKL